MLQADDAEMRDLALVLVQVVTEEVGLAVDGEARPQVAGMHAGQIWNLEPVIRGTQDHGDTVVLIQ